MNEAPRLGYGKSRSELILALGLPPKASDEDICKKTYELLNKLSQHLDWWSNRLEIVIQWRNEQQMFRGVN